MYSNIYVYLILNHIYIYSGAFKSLNRNILYALILKHFRHLNLVWSSFNVLVLYSQVYAAMERNNDYLKIIEDTFGLFSNDSLSDCKKVIDDVINTFKKNNSHKINDVIPSSKGKLIQTATLSLKVLLQFYEKLLSRSNEKLVLSFDPLLQIIKDFLLNNQEVFDSSSYVEEDLLHIFSLLFKIALLQNSEDNLSALVKFYHYNLDFISRNYTSDDSDIINLNLSLKIVCGLYAVLGSEWEQKNRIQFLRVMNKLKAESTNKEHKLFASLVIYGNDNIVIKTLLFVLPNFITCFKDTEVVDIIWKDISNLISDENTNIQYSRILLILCYLFNMCFFENILANKTKIMKILFEDNNYWKVIQFGLSNNDPVIKKQAMYLLKKTVDLLINTEENIKCHVGCISNISSNLKHAWWDSNFKQEFSNIYADLIVIFEYLNEQQVHIIKPMFRLVENFIKKTLVELNNEITIDFSWVLLIHEQALKHESTQVVKWGLDSLFKLPDNFNSDKNTTVRLVNLLISTLNNTNLYYNDGLNISKKLTIYFDKFTKLKTSEIFFGSFITKVCSVTWNPEALFFVMHALAQISRNSFWKEKEIVAIKNFVEKAFKTHNKIIRAGIQCELLNSIIALTDEKNVSLENMIFVLSSFSTADSLHRGSLIWNNVVTWMRNIYSEEEAKKCLEKHSSDTPDKKFSLKSLALMIVLFFDAYHYEVTDRDIEKFDCFTINAFRKILLSFRGIEKRLYCDKSVFYNHLMLVAEILEKHLNFEEPKESKLLKIMIPFFNDIASYVKIQMMDMSKIEDYYAVPLYNKIIHYILNMQLLYNVGSENIINEFYLPIATHLENYEQSRKPLPSVKMYCWMQLLKTLFNSDSFEPNYVKLSGIYSYLTKAVNEPLRKDFISSEMSLDLQTLWGKMNSEYLESKWDILEYLMRSTTLMQELKNNKRIEILSDLDLINFCDEALTIGGYGVLCPVMSILKNILLKWNEIKGEERIHLIWELILERRKTDSFKRLIKQFVEMLFQIKLILRESNVQEIHLTVSFWGFLANLSSVLSGT